MYAGALPCINHAFSYEHIPDVAINKELVKLQEHPLYPSNVGNLTLFHRKKILKIRSEHALIYELFRHRTNLLSVCRNRMGHPGLQGHISSNHQCLSEDSPLSFV